MALNFIPINTKINFVRYKFIFYLISLIIILGTFGLVVQKGLNYGVDFRGGFLISVRTVENANIANLRAKLAKMHLGEISIQEMGSAKDVQIKIERQPGGDEAQSIALTKIKSGLGSDVEYRTVETVGPKVGQELISNAIKAVIYAMIGMLIYVWFRFEWQFSVSSIVAIFHDCVTIVGMYALFGIEFNITAIMAILVTAGYSINDTIVIFDRIRENLVRYKKMPMADLINRSINETLSRTILTSTTTLLALGALYFFGGDTISTYSLPIMVGVGVGTYSSILLAAPLLLHLGFKKEREKPVNKEEKIA
jgi:preprotein translocase SecF subunit